MVFMAASFSLRLAREGGMAQVILFSAAAASASISFSDVTNALGRSGVLPSRWRRRRRPWPPS